MDRKHLLIAFAMHVLIASAAHARPMMAALSNTCPAEAQRAIRHYARPALSADADVLQLNYHKPATAKPPAKPALMNGSRAKIILRRANAALTASNRLEPR